MAWKSRLIFDGNFPNISFSSFGLAMKTGVSDAFLNNLREEIDRNLNNDQFGVEALASNVGMSRSQLHRKLMSATGQSVSQFIREHRLRLGMEFLRETELTAAEVADRVGFGSATYFSKCFTDLYGFPPGEVKFRETLEQGLQNGDTRETRGLRANLYLTASLVALVVMIMIVFYVALPSGDNKPLPSTAERSLAILPFKELNPDGRDAYLSEGIVEAIRSDLSMIGDLRVISRTSVEQYRNGTKPAREIARELGVASLLEGTFQRDGNRIRIAVRLIDGISEGQLWSATYDRELDDVFSIQNEIAQHVVTGLKARLSAEERRKLSQPDTDNPRAYDLYLRGVYEYRTYTNAGAHNAIALFSDAIAIDSNYARAYAFLANGYIGLATIWGAELNALEGLEKGKPFIDRALAIDPDLDIAHSLMGFYRLYHDWDFVGAEESYKRGIMHEHPDAMAVYIDYLNFMSRHGEAMALTERLNAKDPYYPNSRMMLSCFYNGRTDEGLRYSEARLKVFNNYYTYDGHGFLLLNSHRYDEAIVFFRKAIALEGIRYPRMLGWMAAAYAKSGDRAAANEIVAELERRLEHKEGGSIAFFLAVIHAALKENETALAWLRRAYDDHDMEMPWLMTEPQLYPLHDEPVFREIANQMGFR